MSRIKLVFFIIIAISNVTSSVGFGPFSNSSKDRLVVSERQNLDEAADKLRQMLALSENEDHDSASSAALAAVEHLRAASLDSAALGKLGEDDASYRQAVEIQYAAKVSEIATEQRNLAALTAEKKAKVSDKRTEGKISPSARRSKRTNFKNKVQPDGSINIDDVKSDVDRVFWPQNSGQYLNYFAYVSPKNLKKINTKVHLAKKNFGILRDSTDVPF